MTLKTGPFVAAGYVKDSLGNERQIFDTTGAIYPGGAKMTPPSTAAWTAVGTTQAQTLENKTLGTGTARYSETGSTAANLVNYGMSLLSFSTDNSKLYTLAAPAVGIEKFLVLNTTVAPDTTGIFSAVYTGSTAIFIMDNSTAYAPKLYAGLGPPYTMIKLVGVTTALWGVQAAYGNAKFSTSTVFST